MMYLSITHVQGAVLSINLCGALNAADSMDAVALQHLWLSPGRSRR